MYSFAYFAQDIFVFAQHTLLNSFSLGLIRGRYCSDPPQIAMWFVKVIGRIVISKTHAFICLYTSDPFWRVLVQCTKKDGPRKRASRRFIKIWHIHYRYIYLQLQGAFTLNLSIMNAPILGPCLGFCTER
jgi:hypothetical protein